MSDKNSIIDNEEREKWTHEDPMVRGLRTGCAACTEEKNAKYTAPPEHTCSKRIIPGYDPSAVEDKHKAIIGEKGREFFGPSSVKRKLEERFINLKNTGMFDNYLSDQKEFKLPVQNLTEEFIYNRIHGQFIYCEEVLARDISNEKRKELMDSAMGGAVNFALSVGTLDAYKILAKEIILWTQKH